MLVDFELQVDEIAFSGKFYYINICSSGLTVPDIPPAKRKLDLSQFSVKHEERQRE